MLNEIIILLLTFSNHNFYVSCYLLFQTETSISGTLRVVKKNLCLSSSDGVVKLDLSEAGQPVKPLFMNQVVVVSGTIPDNKVFKVRQLFTNAALPLSKNLPSFSRGL